MKNHDIKNNNDKVVGSIYSTTDYDKFDFFLENRDPNDPKLKKHQSRLKEYIKKGDELPPIEVDENFFIIDGQNRFMAYSELGLPIRYFFGELRTDKQLGIINGQGQKKWTIDNHIDFHIAKGNRNYTELKNYIEKTNFPTAVAMRVLSDGKFVRPNQLPSGDFELSNEEKGYEFADKVFKHLPERPPIYALEAIFKLWNLSDRMNFERLANIYLANEPVIRQLRNYENSIEFFAKKYNYKLDKKNRVKVEFNKSGAKKYYV